MARATVARSARWLAAAALCALAWAANAQPIPYTALAHDDPMPEPAGAIAASATPLSDALRAAKGGDVNRALALQAALADPVAKKLVDWELVDQCGSMLGVQQILGYDRELQGWPRAQRRQAAVERALAAGLPSPADTIAWFAGREPQTGDGAYALAVAEQAQGRQAEAAALIRRFWREHAFEADAQARIQARFAAVLTADDNNRRLENLLYTSSGPAVRAMMALVDADHQQLAEARMALRANRDTAPGLVAALPASVQADGGPGVRQGALLPQARPGRGGRGPAQGRRRRSARPRRRRRGVERAPRADDRRAEEQRLPGRLRRRCGPRHDRGDRLHRGGVLRRLDRPVQAARPGPGRPALRRRAAGGLHPRHPQPRALLARARGPGAGRCGRGPGLLAPGRRLLHTAFYGQLSAERAGVRTLTLGVDPTPTAADRTAFDARETVRAARLLADNGQRDLFGVFALSIADDLASVQEAALLVDLARASGVPAIATRAARVAVTRGLYLPDRGWPVLSAPTGPGLPEPAFTLAIVRQESGFDPAIRSGVGARGLMQLMPATAAITARRQGLDYSPARLDDGDYNMRLGSAYLGQLTDDFSGSYVLAAAGYNAGPGRAGAWANQCGDPRQATIDPADFIECIPFSETRNYVMRVLESVEIYRARLNGGAAPLTLLADLHRGGYAPSSSALQTAAQLQAR